ncbi:MAG: PhoH family protein [Candidatus Didemnitutus sp.]|nr:PhoH family protein [Candidatus Didemnitutus sp.]
MPTTKTLHFPSARQLTQLYCNDEDNLALVEQKLGTRLITRDDWLKIEGPEAAIVATETFFDLLNTGRAQGLTMRTPDFQRLLATYAADGGAERLRELFTEPMQLGTSKRTVVPKTIGQKLYLQAIQKNTVVFGIGPAGTGKTYLAMAAAITALMKGQVQRVILTRPAVEAGETLGFLPGDLREKILPYLRPLYDAMNDLLSPEDAATLAEKGIIEIAPLAYMRGRTLANAYVILDEAQNTTPEQMMMFLTRLGDDSRMIITGDITQIDLPRSKASGLIQAPRILHNIPGIEIHHFTASDVVRHPLVQLIIDAYEHARSSGTDVERPGHPKSP